MHCSFLHSKQTHGGLPPELMSAGRTATETAERVRYTARPEVHTGVREVTTHFSVRSLLPDSLCSLQSCISLVRQGWQCARWWLLHTYTRLSGRPWVEFLKKKGDKDGL